MANRRDDVKWRALLTSGAVRCLSSGRWDGEEVVLAVLCAVAVLTMLLQ